MFGFFCNSTCPVDPKAKIWIEERLQWLAEQFTEVDLRERPIILPTSEFFPDPYDGSDEALVAMFNRVCDYMGVSPDLVTLELYSEEHRPNFVNAEGHYLSGSAGLYEEGSDQFTIRIEQSQLAEPMDLVGTIAHELAHVRLLGESRISPDAFDNELATDLTTVFMGLGIFLANRPRANIAQTNYWPGTDIRRPEYMSMPMYGYALAHLAWWRGEEKPAWLRHLHYHARCETRQGIRYLARTGDSWFRPG
jgi:hypothetical protein